MQLDNWVLIFIEVSALFLIFCLGLVILGIGWMYIVDVTQTTQAVRRSFPVIGRFRYLFERLGEFFRQYFFSMDREEMPFNRAQRSWVYRASKNLDTTVAFGSTRSLSGPGKVIFLNDLFPKNTDSKLPEKVITIGEGYADKPYAAKSFFNISGMSFGSLSVPAVRALSHGAKKAGIWMNTGEGGLSTYHLEGGCDLVFQIGTAKYGVRDESGQMADDKLREVAQYEQVRMFEIKMSQGAKPGKGGILPGGKVTKLIAEIRGIPAGEDSISPNAHADINNIDDLLDMIVRIRKVTGKPCGFKTVVGRREWIKGLCETIHRRGFECAPDFITVDSADGGTGAAPQSLIDFVGLPLHTSLPLVVDTLTKYDLRRRIKVIASGKLINPSEVAWAFCAGADFTISARAFMFALGCIQALQCNKNTCPTGIATHDHRLQRGLVYSSKIDMVDNLAKNMMHEVCVIANSCGVTYPHDLNRSHAYIVNERNVPEPMSERFPEVTPDPQYRSI